MKKNKKWIIITSIALVVIVGGVVGATRFNFSKKNNEEEDKREVVRRGEFLVKIQETGNLRSLLEVDVRSNVEGEIVEIFVEESDVVEVNDPLLKIDEEQIKEERKQAEGLQRCPKSRT